MNYFHYAMMCIWDTKFMRKSTYQIEDDINAKLRGHRMHFKTKDMRFGKTPGNLWQMEYAMSMNVTKHGKQWGDFEIYFTIFPWTKRKNFVIQVEVEPEKHQAYFSDVIKASPGGLIEVGDFGDIPKTVAKTMKRIKQWAKNPRPLY